MTADGAGQGTRWRTSIAKLALTVGVTWLILRGAGIRLAEAGAVDWSVLQINGAALALSIALLFGPFGMATVLWPRILEQFGEPRIDIRTSFAILVVANLGRYVPGKVMQLAGIAVLARRRGLSGLRATAAAIAAQMISLLGAAAVGGWAALWSTDPSRPLALFAGLAIVVALVAFVRFDGIGVLLRWIARRSSRQTGALPRPDGRRLLFLLPGYILIWIVYGVAFVLLSRGIGLELGYAVGGAAFAAAYFLGYVALFAPAGIGVRESVLVVILTPILGLEPSVMLAALQRAWITAAELVAAAAGVFLLRAPAMRVQQR